MNDAFQQLSQIIRQRRAVYPSMYRKEAIDPQIIHLLIDNARWAPSHKLTQPWRFVILTEAALSRLSKILSDYYRQHTPVEIFSESKYKKAGERANQSACVLLICIERSVESIIPAWEETAAVACAVQNLWLSASVLGIGSYWSTPQAIQTIPALFSLPPSWECLGLFYMGWLSQTPDNIPTRNEVESITLHFNQ